MGGVESGPLFGHMRHKPVFQRLERRGGGGAWRGGRSKRMRAEGQAVLSYEGGEEGSYSGYEAVDKQVCQVWSGGYFPT